MINSKETRVRNTPYVKLVYTMISGKEAFRLYQSFGFPIEMTVELAKERGVSVDVAGFEQEVKKHKEISQAGYKQKFKGGIQHGRDH